MIIILTALGLRVDQHVAAVVVSVFLFCIRADLFGTSYTIQCQYFCDRLTLCHLLSVFWSYTFMFITAVIHIGLRNLKSDSLQSLICLKCIEWSYSIICLGNKVMITWRLSSSHSIILVLCRLADERSPISLFFPLSFHFYFLLDHSSAFSVVLDIIEPFFPGCNRSVSFKF
jgi:hypothetical protein